MLRRMFEVHKSYGYPVPATDIPQVKKPRRLACARLDARLPESGPFVLCGKEVCRHARQR
ncbi:protein of unknown function [Paraburkholderia kururiensis]